MRIQVTLEREINWRDKQKKIPGYQPDELFLLLKDILTSNGLRIAHIDKRYRILDTRIINRSKINIKVTDDCVVKVNILNAYSVSPYDRFWEVVNGYLQG